MSAFGELVVVDELHIRLLRPALRRLINFFRKRAHADRKLDPSRVEEAACRQIMPHVPVETRRRDRGIRQPIERDVVENVVAAQPFRLAVENAGDHLVAANVVIKYPARKTNRQIDDSVERLWPKRHLVRVAQPILIEVIELIPRVLFVGRKVRGRRAARGKCPRNIGRNRRRHGYRAQTLSAYLKQPAPPGAPTIIFPKITKELAKRNFFEYLDFALQFAPRRRMRLRSGHGSPASASERCAQLSNRSANRCETDTARVSARAVLPRPQRHGGGSEFSADGL